MKRLYAAICSLLEVKAKAIANPAPAPEPQMEGSYTQAERSGDYEPDELHADQYRIGFTGELTPPPVKPLERRTKGWLRVD